MSFFCQGSSRNGRPIHSPLVCTQYRSIQPMTLAPRVRRLGVAPTLDPSPSERRVAAVARVGAIGTPLLDGIPVLDLGERYRAAGLDWSAVSLDVPGHLTRVGHRQAAEAFAAALAGPLPSGWDYRSTCRAD